MPPKKQAPRRSSNTVSVDRAVEAARRAIGRLVKLLDDEDEGVFRGACRALDDLGARAVVGPLAAALPRASARHRTLIILALQSCGREEMSRVSLTLISARKRERDPEVAAVIVAALASLMLSETGT